MAFNYLLTVKIGLAISVGSGGVRDNDITRDVATPGSAGLPDLIYIYGCCGYHLFFMRQEWQWFLLLVMSSRERGEIWMFSRVAVCLMNVKMAAMFGHTLVVTG